VRSLCGFVVGRNLLLELLLRGGLLRVIELEDGSYTNAVGAHRLLGLLGRVPGVANLAFNLYV
jgi:hypothetical protein